MNPGVLKIDNPPRSFPEDLKCCREALSKMGFIYSVIKAKVCTVEPEPIFALQAVMKSAAPFIHNLISMDTKDNMQVNQNMMCGHVGVQLENCGVGGRQGGVADDIFNDVIYDDIFDDNMEIFLI
jgi:hypothetical protein